MAILKKINFLYIPFIFFILIITFFYANADQVNDLIGTNNKIIFERLKFDHSKLVINLFYQGEYFQERYGINYYLAKLPILPLLITFLAKISTNIYFIYFSKNFILFTILYFSAKYYCKKQKRNILFFLCLIAFFIIIPHNLHVLLSIHFADTIVASLLPSLFLILITEHKSKHYIASIILFFLYLTKTSMFFLCILLPFVIILIEQAKIQLKILSAVVVVLAIFIWGIFGYGKTGVFPFGSKILSVTSEGMSIALNKDFHNYYPKKSVDLLKIYKIKNNSYNNEWDVYAHYKQLNNDYLRENYSRYFLDTLIKIKFILFNIHKESVWPDRNGIFHNPIMISHIVNRCFFNLSLIISFFVLLRNFKKLSKIKNEIYFLAIISTNLFPLVGGWATSKHLTGIYIVSIIYVLIKVYDKLILFFKSNSNLKIFKQT